MAITLKSTNFMLKNDGPDGKLWGKMLIHLMDDDTDTGRNLDVEVLLDRSATATFDSYETQARADIKSLLTRVIESL